MTVICDDHDTKLSSNDQQVNFGYYLEKSKLSLWHQMNPTSDLTAISGEIVENLSAEDPLSSITSYHNCGCGSGSNCSC